MSEIAELAGVRRPVVTTWRRRYPDFPAPLDNNRGRPLFDARQVVDWLVMTGRAERDRIEPDLRLYLLTCLADGTSNGAAPSSRRRGTALPPRELISTITALICLRHLDDELLWPDGRADRHVIAELRERAADVDPDDELLLSEIEALPADAGWLAAAVDELIEAAWGCPQAYERVMAARHRLGATELYVDAVTPVLARLMAGLCGAREHADTYGEVCIADPAARAGDLLMAVRERLSEFSDVTFVAAEADPFLARILRRRLAVHDVAEQDRLVHIADTLPPGRAPDALVTRLPYQPKEDRDAEDRLVSVRRIADALNPGQTAVILGPADLLVGSLAPYHPSAGTRRDLLTSGRVEAVIQLPGGVVPFRPGYQAALWVLRHEDPSPWQGQVLLVDISDRPLTVELVETLVWDITTWRRHGHHPGEHLRAYAQPVKVAALTSVPRVPLTTRRPVRLRERLRDPHDTITRVTEVEVELSKLAEPAAVPRPEVRSGLAVRDQAVRPQTQSIATLVRTDHLALVKGHRIATGDIVPDGHHPVLGVPELTGAVPIGGRSIDRGVSAAKYPHVALTRPGDVVVTLVPHLAVHLDEEGFSVVEFPARVLRILPDGQERFTPRVLAALLASTTSVGRAPSAIRAAARLADLQLPLLPPAEVARLDALLAAADARRAVIRRELALINELCRVVTTGLTDGTLTIATPP